MSYRTEFDGVFRLDRPLTAAHARYLTAFAKSRRVHLPPEAVSQLTDPIREAAGLPTVPAYRVALPLGKPYDFNTPPKGQPGLWCQWRPTANATGIEWDRCSNFYDYVEWLQYLIDHFLKPWGYTLTGTVRWRGEEFDDVGRITVTANAITVTAGPA